MNELGLFASLDLYQIIKGQGMSVLTGLDEQYLFWNKSGAMNGPPMIETFPSFTRVKLAVYRTMFTLVSRD